MLFKYASNLVPFVVGGGSVEEAFRTVVYFLISIYISRLLEKAFVAPGNNVATGSLGPNAVFNTSASHQVTKVEQALLQKLRDKADQRGWTMQELLRECEKPGTHWTLVNEVDRLLLDKWRAMGIKDGWTLKDLDHLLSKEVNQNRLSQAIVKGLANKSSGSVTDIFC